MSGRGGPTSSHSWRLRMWLRKQRNVLWLVLALLVGCAGPAGPSSQRTDVPDGMRQTTSAKRVTAAIAGESPGFAPGESIPGDDALHALANAGLVVIDDHGEPLAQLAEAVPTLENGLWKVFPDGHMELTWKMRADARWQDGAPFIADDLVFTTTVGQDSDLPSYGHEAYRSVERIQASDPRTLTIQWKDPYIFANHMFSHVFASPLPRHILENTYVENKESFTELPYWSSEYVGTGPFQVREWVLGSHVVLTAFDDFALGRPKIDEIDVRFISDTTTLAANILAGSVELTLGRALDLDKAIQVRDQWRDGTMDIGFKSWIAIFPQFVNPNPPIIADVRFRRALLHAIDRQQLADTIQGGLVPVAHSYLNPSEPEYREIEGSIVRYDYDVRKAGQMIEALGLAKGPDGTFRDSTGEHLSVEIRTIGVTAEKAILAVTDFWQRAGIATQPVTIPAARTRDTEYRATFPGFQIFQNPNDINGLLRLHSSNAPLPENNFRVTGNHSRYLIPEFDALIEKLFATIPRQERVQVLGQVVHHISDQLNVMGLYYGVEPAMITNRLQQAGARKVQTSVQSWNAHEWELSS
ncbi:MAG: hypothetical protein GEU73_15250 [Chloroflexi bacterium]|nr:hypothetical protein [Chloroflexota bacterium]